MNSSIQAKILHQAAIERHNQKKAVWDAQCRIFGIQIVRYGADVYYMGIDPAKPKPERVTECPKCGSEAIQRLGEEGSFCYDCDWNDLRELAGGGMR